MKAFKETKFWGALCNGAEKIKVKSPQIMIVSGVTMLIGAGIWACKKTTKLHDTLDGDISDLEDIKEDLKVDDISEEEHKELTKSMVKATGKVIWDTTKLYAGPAALGIGGAGLVLGGTNILSKRNAVLTGAYGALKTSFDGYRDRVKAKIGSEAEDKIFKGIKEVTVEEEKTNKKTGETKTVEKKGEILDDSKLGPYSFIYDSTFGNFEKNAQYNYDVLLSMQGTLNSILRSRAVTSVDKFGNSVTVRRGKMFLDEPLRRLGMPEDMIPDTAKVTGWIYDPNCEPNTDGIGDNCIDLGILDMTNERFINRWENACLLNFNCDGVIYDKV